MAKYTVRKGDSWARIAGRVYGSQRWFGELASANRNISLHPGMKIDIPDFDTAKQPYVNPQQMIDVHAAEGKGTPWLPPSWQGGGTPGGVPPVPGAVTVPETAAPTPSGYALSSEQARSNEMMRRRRDRPIRPLTPEQERATQLMYPEGETIPRYERARAAEPESYAEIRARRDSPYETDVYKNYIREMQADIRHQEYLQGMRKWGEEHPPEPWQMAGPAETFPESLLPWQSRYKPSPMSPLDLKVANAISAGERPLSFSDDTRQALGLNGSQMTDMGYHLSPNGIWVRREEITGGGQTYGGYGGYGGAAIRRRGGRGGTRPGGYGGSRVQMGLINWRIGIT